jgi:hypothetical protein
MNIYILKDSNHLQVAGVSKEGGCGIVVFDTLRVAVEA